MLKLIKVRETNEKKGEKIAHISVPSKVTEKENKLTHVQAKKHAERRGNFSGP